MRLSGCLFALSLTGCSIPNPTFQLAPDGATGADATGYTSGTGTQGTGTQGTGTQGPTTGASGVVGSSSGEPPGTSTGVEPGTSTGLESTGSAGSTGDMVCGLSRDFAFDDQLRINGLPAQNCFVNPTVYVGKLLAGDQPLNFITSNTGCPNESNVGTLTLGDGYSIPVIAESGCAIIGIGRDGPGPNCDIGNFHALDLATNKPILTGSFSATEPMKVPDPLITPTYDLLECCPPESQGCCMDGVYGDLLMTANGVMVGFGAVESVPLDEGQASVLNIQHWQTGDCGSMILFYRYDWAAVRN